MGLGKHLVRELGFEDGVDTLGRWMAHHLATLIDEAENGATPAKRSKAGQKATETILKIWEHRTLLPGKSYPLAPYKDVLTVIRRLRPDDNPFRYYGHDPGAKRDQIAALLFDRLTRLIIALLLMRMRSDAKSTGAEDSAVEALSGEEQQILRTMDQWFELLAPSKKGSRQRGKSRKSSKETEINLNEVALQFIDSISTSLTALRNELQIGKDMTDQTRQPLE